MDKRLLVNTRLFRGIGEEELETLLDCLGAIRRTYDRGEVILREGEPTERMGVVLSGMVLIESGDLWGGRHILGSAGPGAVFAEAYACIPGEPLMVSVSAAEATEALFLHVGRAMTVCASACAFHTRLVQNLLGLCAEKSLQLSRRILHTGAKTIRGRLLSYFSEQVRRSGSYAFRIPYDRQQLADYLGVDRSALCGELSKMRRDGLIRYRKNQFELCGPL